jgi:hypothetical protein
VPVSFSAEHGHRTKGRDGGRRRLLIERKGGNGEGSGVGGATRSKEEGRGPSSVAPHGGGRRGGPGSRQGALLVGAVAGRASTTREGERGSACGPTGEGGSWVGPDRTVLILI